MRASEFIVEAVGNDYLYHATQPAAMLHILDKGLLKASYRPQQATIARTNAPTISTTRSRHYAESDEFIDNLNLTYDGNAVILVLDRPSIANQYKMFSSSQGTQTFGDEYEEVIVVPKGSMPVRGKIKGFYFNPNRRNTIKDYEDVPWFTRLLNSPYLLNRK